MGKVFFRKNRKKWGIDYIDPYGKRVRRIVSLYREGAELALKKVEMNIVEGKYLDKVKTKAIKFEEFVDVFVQNHINIEHRHPESQKGRVTVIKEYFKGLYLDQVDSLSIRTFIAQKMKQHKPATVNRYLALIKCLFNRAIDWKMYQGENPTKGVKKLPEHNERCRWLSDKEQAFLLSHCHGLTRIIVLTALQTGLRWGEIMSLKWIQSNDSSYVDFENNVIIIHGASAKSKKSRYIPMSYSLQCELFDLKKASQYEYVFANPKTGRPFDNIRKSFLNAVKKAGLKDLRFHDLRHAFASNLVRKGVDLYVVQQLLGHSTPKMTQRYAHIRPDHFKSAIQEIDLSLGLK